uniref:Bm303 n=1 Tax=Brugia malayi TaxID=6279 RepID=A0A0K0J8H3_BRUMA|nr:Bm303 [Brugia malayi]
MITSRPLACSKNRATFSQCRLSMHANTANTSQIAPNQAENNH